MVATIVVSVVNFFLETTPALEDSAEVWIVELSCTAIFSLELLLRTYVGSPSPRQMACDPGFWIDVLATAPFYIQLALRRGQSSGRLDLQAIDLQAIEVLEVMKLLRLVRILKLMKHFTDWRVMLIALSNSWRALLVPGFSMLIAVLLLSGALIVAERITAAQRAIPHGNATSDEEGYDAEPFRDGFEAMWCIFWIVFTLGYDGDYGTLGPAQRLIFACAVVCGLLFTTMPITIIGEAFHSAWEKKELLEVQIKISAMLEERGLSMHELQSIFSEFDTSGDGQLDWTEFKSAMKRLGLKVPISKLRQLFAQFDEDETGEVEWFEFARVLFPNLDSDGSEDQPPEVPTAAQGAGCRVQGAKGLSGMLRGGWSSRQPAHADSGQARSGTSSHGGANGAGGGLSPAAATVTSGGRGSHGHGMAPGAAGTPTAGLPKGGIPPPSKKRALLAKSALERVQMANTAANAFAAAGQGAAGQGACEARGEQHACEGCAPKNMSSAFGAARKVDVAGAADSGAPGSEVASMRRQAAAGGGGVDGGGAAPPPVEEQTCAFTAEQEGEVPHPASDQTKLTPADAPAPVPEWVG